MLLALFVVDACVDAGDGEDDAALPMMNAMMDRINEEQSNMNEERPMMMTRAVERGAPNLRIFFVVDESCWWNIPIPLSNRYCD
jgi:hypothetical protein